MKNRITQSILYAYKKTYHQLLEAGLRPKMQICDNECSKTFKFFLKEEKINLQLVPPYDHRTNPAEKSIDNFKSHFITGLASLSPTFPMHLWYRLIEHAVITINLLRKSKLHPKISAYAHIYEAFDFNRTPLAPPGCVALAYDSPNKRATWKTKGTDGFYIGPAMEHYRCHKIYTPKTRAERVAKTVEFFPHNCATPYSSPVDDATRTADSLVDALKGHQAFEPYEAPGNEQFMAIKKISHIFSQLVASRKKEKSVDSTATSPRVKDITDTPLRVTHNTPKTPRVTTMLPNPKAPSEHGNLPHVIPY